ncbi:hypothetical protein BD413DRAFT_493416 [Trametes elegans]|nr:hypothetical protein BD413DRAFT_493416 [Trametes elegans]
MTCSLWFTILLTAVYLTHRVIAAGSDTESGNNSVIRWGPCDSSTATNASLSCGFLRVPLDYHDPSAGHGRIAVVKANATGDRRGTVLLNPGGPGVSGIDAVAGYSRQLLYLTGGVYDVVGWDPRGVGSLTIPGEVYCFDSVAEYGSFWNGTIELSGIEFSGKFTEQYDIDALLSKAKLMQGKYEELGQRCLRQPSGRYLPYVGTAATARDVIALVDTLDGPGSPINFIGLSYGSLLGSWLINLVPERVGRVILDGVVNPVPIATEETPFIWPKKIVDDGKLYEGLAIGCALSAPEGCPIATPGQSASDVNSDIQGLIQSAYDAARKNSSGPVTSADIRQELWYTVDDTRLWQSFANTTYPAFAAGVQAEVQGHSLIRGRTPVSGRSGDGGRNDTESYSTVAILCADSVDPRATSMEDVFKYIISAVQNGTVYKGPFNATLVSTVLVVSNLYDPVTPLSDAQAVADLLGDSAALHISISAPSACTNAVMRDFFVNGTASIPTNGTVCQVDDDFELFPRRVLRTNCPTSSRKLPAYMTSRYCASTDCAGSTEQNGCLLYPWVKFHGTDYKYCRRRSIPGLANDFHSVATRVGAISPLQSVVAEQY